jgi:DNA mismatch repair protein MutL
VPRIHLLPSDLINQIAAGEVVERPASVVKELVENAIDAGATVIDVLLENGGKKLIEVRDNGHGMAHDDALLALERHATSKIAGFDDLSQVRTLGFRGEALPSIASVSRFALTTYDGGADAAIEIECDPLTGMRTSRPAARDRGTTISVRELFENVPARRKFLKSSDAEFRSIVTIVSSYALPLPSRAFRIEHNGRTVVDLPPALTMRERVVQIVGNDAAPFLEEIDITIGQIRASGFVTRGLRFGSRRNQFFFVNGRLVKDRVLTHAANRGADAFDFDGHPAIVLFLDIEPDLVDVNVHPAKTEVRFRDSGAVHVAVEQGIKRALGGAEEGSELLQAAVAPTPTPATLFSPQRFDDAPRGYLPEFTPLFQRQSVVQPPLREQTATIEAPLLADGPQLGDLQGRVIGQYRMSYIVIDTPTGLRLIDQHVAHERVLYDRYFERAAEQTPMTQQLLTPILYESGAAESAVLESHLDELRMVGFDIERFSGNAFAIAAVPPELVKKDVDAFLRKLIDASQDDRSHLLHVREKVCASLACQAAIKIHRPLNGEEMARLTAELLDSSNPYACPHGRPIIVDIRHLDIEKHFHRK